MTEIKKFNDTSRSWLDRIAFALTGEPKDRKEFVNIMRIAAERGLIDHDVLRMFEGVLKMQELRVRDAMIPRAQIVTIKHDMPFNEIVTIVVKSGHSRFPVIRENKDEVLGILLAKDLLAYSTSEHASHFKIDDIIRQTLFIPDSKRLSSLLREFQNQHSHLAVVVDEYGGITGLITIEDLIEQIVGEIEDEYDVDEEPLIRKADDNTYVIKALTPIADFNKYFSTNLDDTEFETIGGLVMHKLGRLPKRGEIVSIGNLDFKILRADTRRVYLLQLIEINYSEAGSSTKQ